jgi:hypothetical protein
LNMRILSPLNSLIFSFAMLILAFAVLSWLKVPVGSFGDWVAGLLVLFWLLAIVTVPWNIHFKARALLNDAQATRERGLPVDDRQVAYVRKLVGGSLWVAIALHVASAVALFVLAKTGVVRVGYFASVVALLLTALRPAMSAYEYLAERLRTIGHNWKYPREDVIELKGRVDVIETSVREIRQQLDPEKPESLVSLERTHAEESRRQMAKVAADLDELRATNENDHIRLAREAQSAISQITTDGQFLDHVREILRFFKSA